jgi:hypothetical protein
MKIEFYSVECTNAINSLKAKLGMYPRPIDFEKEFHCKIIGNQVIFNSMRDYTWFILKWGLT